MSPKSIVIVLSMILVFGFLTPVALAQSKLDVFTNSTHHSATSSVTIQNEYLKIEVGNNGQYRGWTAAGDAIFYPYGAYPWSSFITIKVDGSIYDNAPWSSNLDNYLTQETVKKSSVETETKWYIPEKLEITQDIILVGEQAKFTLKLKNTGTVSKTVSVRYEWDTQIADNDGAPLREEGGDLHEFEIAFEPVTFSYWSAYARPQPGSLVIYATWDTTPDKIIFAHWPEAYGTLWDYSWSSNRRFYTPGYTTSPESDSCVLMYWKDITLQPGEEKSIVTYYGTTVGGGVNVDISTEKYYYSSGEDIRISAKVTDASGNPLYPLEKRDFKVSVDGNEVSIKDFERISATDYRLVVEAPQEVGSHSIMIRADTSMGWGSDTIGIKVYKISKVSLTVGGNRLTQYENSADTPIYYRGDSNVYPVFHIDVEVDGATLSEIKDYIQVFVKINDYAKVKDPIIKQAKALWVDYQLSKYVADWKNSPDNYPVGKYNVTAEVKDLNGNLLASSQKKYFYLIFKPPSGYENFVSYQISAEIHHAYPAPDPIPGGAFIGTKFYNLHQFEYRNWKNTLDFLTGPNKFGWDPYPAIYTERQAIERLMTFAHGIDISGCIDDSYYGYWHMDDNESQPLWDVTHIHGNYIYGTFGTSKDYSADGLWPNQNAWWYDVNKFKDSNFNPEHKNLPHNRPTGVCADYAPLLISHSRSAGIPAREIGGFFAGGGGHAVTEVYYDGKWHHVDPTWNVMELPWIYSVRGDYWTSYKTSSKSPWNVFPLPRPGIKTDVIDRKDCYNYIAKAINIEFDKTDYNYPDTVNIDITVKNTGKVPITADYLHLLIFDKPTILRLGVTHLKCDIQIKDDLNPGDTRTYSCSFQLPDYGLLNELYEWLGDRYIVAQIDYYNRTFPPYHSIATVSKVEKRIPGLCNDWNFQITVDNLAITLNTTNITSIFFNETTNESIETFDKPLNTSVMVEHKVKYYTNHTREIWYIFNPDNITHSYVLTTPLLGIGNAVYIPGYGPVATNESVNTNVSYIVIYNTTTGTNGSIDIYTFSQNLTLRNITILNGIVKVTGVWNTSLAQESGISYLSYFSTRNGNDLSFDEIYSNFAREIINNGDTLTHFFIEGEDRLISYYKVKDTAYINVKVTNNGVLPETRNLNLVITERGPWNSELPVYNITKTVTVPAGNITTLTFQYKIPNNTSIGWHGIRVSDGIAKAATIFMVKAPFNVTFDIPQNVAQKEEFYVNVTITNELNMSFSGINVTIDLPNDFNTSESLTKFIGTLSSGESTEVSWFVTATDFEYGYAPFTLYIDSTEGIRHIASTYTNVLRLPELRIYPHAPSEVRIGIPFVLKANVTNEGDLSIHNVSVRIFLPSNVTTADNLIKSIGDLEAGETKTVSWIITSMRDRDFWINIDGWDESRTYCANATVFINIVKPEIILNLVAPVEVILNQSFPVIAEVKNTGELAADSVRVSLELPPEFDTANDTLVIVGSIAPDETKEVRWILKGIKAGYGEVRVSANNASVTKGIIVSDFPLTVGTDKGVYLQGETVIIATNTTNENPEVSYVDLRMNITIQGQGITETYSRPILYISSLETQEISFSWDTTGKPAGNYTVTARLIEESNSSIVLSEASTSFEVRLPNQPPIADANGPYTGIEGQPVELNASASYDPEGMPLTYYWDFGDGSEATTTNPTTSHVYAQEGNYTVMLIVNDGVQNSTPSMTYALISDTEPIANFTANQTSGFAPLTVQFTDLSTSYDGIVRWEWDFDGDGIADRICSAAIEGPECDLNYTYSQPGNYTVSLIIYEADGDSDTETKEDYITVLSPDTVPPVIEEVSLDRQRVPPGSAIRVSVSTSDNVGVEEVVADGVSLKKIDGMWEGEITVPSAPGNYTLIIKSRDKAGNLAETEVGYSVVLPAGSIAVTTEPKPLVMNGTSTLYIKLISSANFDDIVKVRITTEGIPAEYAADLSWFNATSFEVVVKAEETRLLPVKITTTAKGYHAFRTEAYSEGLNATSTDYGVIYVQ